MFKKTRKIWGMHGFGKIAEKVINVGANSKEGWIKKHWKIFDRAELCHYIHLQRM